MKRIQTRWTSLASVLATAALTACGGSSSSSSPAPTVTIELKGGTGSTGAGGSGAPFYIQNYTGGDVTLLRTGTVNTEVDLPTSLPYLGTNPVEITADTTLEVSADTSTLRLAQDDQSIYNAAGVVTGLKVDAGVTLTIKPNTGSPLRSETNLRLNDGLIVEGTILSAGRDSASAGDSASLDAAPLFFNWVGGLYLAATGKIVADGQANAAGAGGNAGGIRITTNAFDSLGTISAVGGAGTTDGGSGAQIVLGANEGYVVSTGSLLADGGAGASGYGGSGGYIEASSHYSFLVVKGVVSTTGGSGTAGGGSSSGVDFYSEPGDLVVDATIRTFGGDATTDGSGGSGGRIFLEAYGAARVAGLQDTHGGNGAGTGDGATGGWVETETYYEYSLADEGYTNDAESITFGAALNTSGGNGVNGGSAGSFQLYAYAEGSDSPASAPAIQVVGVTAIDSSGGDGATSGGAGAGGNWSYLEADYGEDENNDYAYGSVVNEVDITSNGGSASAGPGGHGGYVELYTAAYYAYPPYDQGVTNSGALTVNGGNGTDGGRSGAIWAYGHTFLQNTAALSASGGAGTTGVGGAVNDAGYSIRLLSDGAVTTSGALTASGGASASGAAAIGGTIEVLGAGQCTVSGALTADGGASTSGAGGSGGEIEIQGQSAASIVADATFSVAAGAGTGSPAAGTVWIDGMQTVGP